MQTMKKTFVLLLSVVITLSLTACGDKTQQQNDLSTEQMAIEQNGLKQTQSEQMNQGRLRVFSDTQNSVITASLLMSNYLNHIYKDQYNFEIESVRTTEMTANGKNTINKTSTTAKMMFDKDRNAYTKFVMQYESGNKNENNVVSKDVETYFIKEQSGRFKLGSKSGNDQNIQILDKPIQSIPIETLLSNNMFNDLVESFVNQNRDVEKDLFKIQDGKQEFNGNMCYVVQCDLPMKYWPALMDEEEYKNVGTDETINIQFFFEDMTKNYIGHKIDSINAKKHNANPDNNGFTVTEDYSITKYHPIKDVDIPDVMEEFQKADEDAHNIVYLVQDMSNSLDNAQARIKISSDMRLREILGAGYSEVFDGNKNLGVVAPICKSFQTYYKLETEQDAVFIKELKTEGSSGKLYRIQTNGRQGFAISMMAENSEYGVIIADQSEENVIKIFNNLKIEKI